jgi:hypothetical protein
VTFASAQSTASTAWSLTNTKLVMPSFTNATGKTTTFTGGILDTLTTSITNQGTLNLESTFIITGSLSNAAGATARVRGTASALADLTVNGGISTAGIFELTSTALASVTLRLNTGTFTVGSGGTLSVLTGSGGTRTLNGNLANDGTLDLFPNAIGTFTVSGNYTQSTATQAPFTGVLRLYANGTVPGTTLTKLAIGGTASLAGTLNIFALGSFTPSAGNYDFMTYASRDTRQYSSIFTMGTGSLSYQPTLLRLVIP